MLLRRLAAGATALAVALTAAGCTSSEEAGTASPAPSWSVVGYAEAGATPVGRLDANRSSITTVGVDGVNVTRDGGAVTAPSVEALRLLRQAHDRGRRAELLVGNFDDRIGDFSPEIGDALLGSPARIDVVAGSLAAEARRHGWDGVTVDLESLSSAHPAGLTRFVAVLKRRLGAGRSVSVCLMASTGPYAELGYDLRGLGRAADHVVLMAYDQHGPTWSGPGPIGGSPWVRAALSPLLAAMPGRRIQLGVAGYGSTWPVHGDGRQLSDAAARSEAGHGGTGAVWDARQQEWHATAGDGTTLWWSDARTIRARISTARALGLGGVAVWSLGLSDPVPAPR